MARPAPASDTDSSPPMIRAHKQRSRPDTPNLQAVPAPSVVSHDDNEVRQTDCADLGLSASPLIQIKTQTPQFAMVVGVGAVHGQGLLIKSIPKRQAAITL